MSDNGLNKTGIYMRLSRDDEKSGESVSIENQRNILRTFVRENGGNIVDEYVDDGWSGTNFERPAIKRLLNDAQSGRIETVVVKDLSRFGRNYIQVGQYIDYIFPAYGIRFIALSDNVDTAERNSAAMDMMPIMNVFNEWHAANTSKKIKTVLRASQRSGKYTSWNYPYGYRAGADENRTAVVDPVAAAVVRRIFNMRVQGNSARAIAKTLSDEGIPNPATYYTRSDGNKSQRRCSPYWSAKTVTWILGNSTYLGTTTQHKTTSVSYKNRKVVSVPDCQRIIKQNSHQPIIDEDLWNRVRRISAGVARGKADKFRITHALSGLLVCADCNKKLKYKPSGRDDSRGCFICRTYADLGKSYCTSHKICEGELEDILLQDIRSHLAPVRLNREKILSHYKKSVSAGEEKSALTQKLIGCKERLAQLDKLISSAFEGAVLNGVPEELCAELCKKYGVERQSVLNEISNLNARLCGAEDDAMAEKYLRSVDDFLKLNALSRAVCLQLIEFITVGEIDGSGKRQVNIYYKFTKPDN